MAAGPDLRPACLESGPEARVLRPRLAAVASPARGCANPEQPLMASCRTPNRDSKYVAVARTAKDGIAEAASPRLLGGGRVRFTVGLGSIQLGLYLLG